MPIAEWTLDAGESGRRVAFLWDEGINQLQMTPSFHSLSVSCPSRSQAHFNVDSIGEEAQSLLLYGEFSFETLSKPRLIRVTPSTHERERLSPPIQRDRLNRGHNQWMAVHRESNVYFIVIIIIIWSYQDQTRIPRWTLSFP